MNVLDLFSGIGGFSLGLERAGMRTVGFCEINQFCREWLAQQWPQVPIHDDIRTLDGTQYAGADLVCGGFPCQDISTAGNGEGLAGGRSGLWFEMLRVIRECRPTWAVVENVTALRTRGADRVLGDLEAIGYTCWPCVVGADDVGAPHRRKRVWLIGRVADADRDILRQFEQRLPGRRPGGIRDQGQALAAFDGREYVADRDRGGCEGERLANDCQLKGACGDLIDGRGSAWPQHSGRSPALSNADGARLEGHAGASELHRGSRPQRPVASAGLRWPAARDQPQHAWEAPRTLTIAQCRLGVATDGLPRSMGETLNKARLHAAGNSIVPVIAELIGRAILRVELG